MALLAEHLLKPLPADKQIETGPFLDAVAHLPPFFDCFGSPVFTPIKADISGNIKTIRAVYDKNPTKFRTLQNILEVEKEMYGPEWPKVGATLALMWLKRGLRFVQVLLQSICDGERDESRPNLIRVNVTKAYEMALKKYHGWLVQKIFQDVELECRETRLLSAALGARKVWVQVPPCPGELCTPPRTSLTSSRPSPKDRTSQKTSAWRRSACFW
uniref:Glycolipid transfer protein n=1 Tax=Vombatus ursinus TaxID=29139 RepID=A0A4X2KDE1_VOMUR